MLSAYVVAAIGYGGLLETLSCAGLVMASLLLIRRAVRPVGSHT